MKVGEEEENGCGQDCSTYTISVVVRTKFWDLYFILPATPWPRLF